MLKQSLLNLSRNVMIFEVWSVKPLNCDPLPKHYLLPNYQSKIYGPGALQRYLLEGKDKKQSPVTGIQFYRASSTGRTFVLATTPTRLYRFSGNASGAAELGGEFSILNVIGTQSENRLFFPPNGIITHNMKIDYLLL